MHTYTPQHTHIQPAARCPPQGPTVYCMPSTTITVSEPCRLREGSHPTPASSSSHTHTHTHTSHVQTALLGLCHQQLLPQPEVTRTACCLPVHLSVHPLEKTQSSLRALCGQVPAALQNSQKLAFVPLPSLWGQERSGLLPWPPRPGPQMLGEPLPAVPWPAPGMSWVGKATGRFS